MSVLTQVLQVTLDFSVWVMFFGPAGGTAAITTE